MSDHRERDLERSESRLVDERDALLASIDAIADQLGVEEEWTSLTDRGACAVEAAAGLEAERDRLRALVARLREILDRERSHNLAEYQRLAADPNPGMAWGLIVERLNALEGIWADPDGQQAAEWLRERERLALEGGHAEVCAVLSIPDGKLSNLPAWLQDREDAIRADVWERYGLADVQPEERQFLNYCDQCKRWTDDRVGCEADVRLDEAQNLEAVLREREEKAAEPWKALSLFLSAEIDEDLELHFESSARGEHHSREAIAAALSWLEAEREKAREEGRQERLGCDHPVGCIEARSGVCGWCTDIEEASATAERESLRRFAAELEAKAQAVEEDREAGASKPHAPLIIEKHRHRLDGSEEVSFYACGPVRGSLEEAKADAQAGAENALLRAGLGLRAAYGGGTACPDGEPHRAQCGRCGAMLKTGGEE